MNAYFLSYFSFELHKELNKLFKDLKVTVIKVAKRSVIK